MYKIFRYSLILLFISSIAFSCKKEEHIPTALPNMQVNFSGTRQNIIVDLPIEGSDWEAYSPTADLWCTFYKVDGKNQVSITVDKNNTPVERSSYILIKTSSDIQKIEVFQDMGRYINFETINIVLRGRSNSQSIEIGANFSTNFTAKIVTAGASWLSATVAGTVLKIDATQNTSMLNNRVGEIEVSGVVPSTGELITVLLSISQKPYGGQDYYFNIPDFSQSNVYKVMDGNKQVAQICKEFLNSSSVTAQAIVVYPVNAAGAIELNEGYVAQVLLAVSPGGKSIDIGAVHGGRIVFDKNTNSISEYTPGKEAKAITTVYMPGDDVMGSTELEGCQLVTAVPDIIIDKRGSESNTYPIVKIATQYWMAKNLSTTKYNSKKGYSDIPTNVSTTNWNGFNTAKDFKPLCCVLGYEDATSPTANATKEKLGVLYTFLAMNGASSIEEANINSENGTMEDNLSPEGWLVPTITELDIMYTYIGGTSTLLSRIRGFVDDNGNPTNLSGNDDENITGFSAINGSYRNSNGSFVALGSPNGSFIWTRTQSVGSGATANTGWSLNLVGKYQQTYMRAFSVRSIRVL